MRFTATVLFFDVAEQRLGEALFLLVVETELNGVVTVLAGLGFDLQNAVGTREHNGDRGDDAARIIDARAAEFFCEKSEWHGVKG